MRKPPTDWFYVCRCGATFKKPVLDSDIIDYLREYHPGATGLCPKCCEPVTLHTVSLPPVSNTNKRPIQERFAEFHADNSHIYPLLVEIATDMLADGKTRISMDVMCHQLLLKYPDLTIIRDTKENPFKLNDHFTSRYARMMVEDYPELEDYIELRRLKAR